MISEPVRDSFVVQGRPDDFTECLREVGCSFQGIEEGGLIDFWVCLNQTATEFDESVKFSLDKN